MTNRHNLKYKRQKPCKLKKLITKASQKIRTTISECFTSKDNVKNHFLNRTQFKKHLLLLIFIKLYRKKLMSFY